MKLQIKKIPKVNKRLIAIPTEQMNGTPPHEFKFITDGKKDYEVHDYYIHERGEMYPSNLFLMATNKNISEEKIWEKYPNSKHIILFVCSELIEQMEIFTIPD